MALTPAQTAMLVQLRRHELLRRFVAEDLQALVSHATVQTCDERETMFTQGDTGQTVLVVVHGYVKLSVLTASGREVVFDVVGPNDVFGELAVLIDSPRAANCRFPIPIENQLPPLFAKNNAVEELPPSSQGTATPIESESFAARK
jgi:CRP/FNR family transcriptional regulator, cyclic AMP receptor protein